MLPFLRRSKLVRVGPTRRGILASELRLAAKFGATEADILNWMFGQAPTLIGIPTALLRFGH